MHFLIIYGVSDGGRRSELNESLNYYRCYEYAKEHDHGWGFTIKPVFTWDDLCERADGKGFGDPELTAKDEARWEIGGYILETEGYDIEDTDVFESAEEMIGRYLEDHPKVFDVEGHLLNDDGRRW